MIHAEIETSNSHRVILQVFGRKETMEMESIPKEESNSWIRKFVSKETGISPEKVFVLNQVHGDEYYETSLIKTEFPEGDALFTSRPGEALVVKTADCMPLFFWSHSELLAGVIHSGWKGTFSGISEKVFRDLYSQNPEWNSFQTFLGPCIRKKNYEVGEDVALKFSEYPAAVEKKADGKYLLGLDLVLHSKLNSLPSSIEFKDCGICTREDDHFYSHRRGDRGRNLNVIYMT